MELPHVSHIDVEPLIPIAVDRHTITAVADVVCDEIQQQHFLSAVPEQIVLRQHLQFVVIKDVIRENVAMVHKRVQIIVDPLHV